MPDFEQGDIVRVPFPYADRETRQRRPALVVSDGGIGEGGLLLWVVMITSAENRGWADDVLIASDRSTGLPVPSVVRPVKIATIDASHAGPIGRAPPEVLGEVLAAIRRATGYRG